MADCQAFTTFVEDEVLAKHHFDTVVLVGRWIRQDFDRLGAAIVWLQARGYKVVVFGPTVEYDTSLLRLLEMERREHDPAMLGRHRNRDVQALDGEMKQIAANVWHVQYVSTFDKLCRPSSVAGGLEAAGCAVYTPEGVPITWDENHFTASGTRYFASLLRPRM